MVFTFLMAVQPDAEVCCGETHPQVAFAYEGSMP